MVWRPHLASPLRVSWPEWPTPPSGIVSRSTAVSESCRHSFSTAICGPTWMNGLLWLLSLSKKSQRPIGVGNGLMHGSSVSVTSAVNACGCLMFPLTSSDQRLCVGVCLCRRVWCNVDVFGSWLSCTAVRDQATGSDCGTGTDRQFPLWDQRKPTASGLLAERRKSGKSTTFSLYFC